MMRTGLVHFALFACALTAEGQVVDVDALTRDSAVRSALEMAKVREARVIADQIRFCEVPAPPFGEQARGEVLRRAFEEAGLEHVRVDRIGNVLGDRRGTRVGPRLVVAAHLDTVFPEGTPLKVTRQGSVLKGPGIGDNCRGLAVLAAIARVMSAASVRTPGVVTFVANVGEEGLGNLRGIRTLFDETLKGQVDRFVTIDNAGIVISTVGVGSHRYRIAFKGPGGHSFAQFGLPNPANALGRAVAQIADFEVPSEPLTTFNVGRIGGGTAVNAIPAEAWMEVDLRSSSPEALRVLDAKLQRAVDMAVQDENARWRRPGVVTATRTLVGDRPASFLQDSAPLVQIARAVARKIGVAPGAGESSSDANYPMSLGIPSITIGGGGSSGDSHATTESFDTTDSWKGTQNAILLTIALLQK